MGRLIARLLVFVLLIAASSAAINWVLIPNHPDAYQAATVDKIRLAAETGSPKVLLVGGSNLAFSIDSGQMEDSLGLPVVNMGLSKATGLRYLLEESRPYVGVGDLVILVPEYELFYDLYYGSESLVVLLQHHPSRIRDVTSFGEVRTILSNFMLMMQMKFSGYMRKGHVDDPVYRRSGFDRRGDLTTHLDLEEIYERRSMFNDEKVPFQRDAITVLNAFFRHASECGATVVLTYPSLYEDVFSEHVDRLTDLDARLRGALEFPVVSRPEDYTFPLEQLYDTSYHLRREGRRIRTERLLKDLHDAGVEPSDLGLGAQTRLDGARSSG